MPKIALEPGHIDAARRLAKSARTADELRQAQAVLFPVDFNLTLAQTAQATGLTMSALRAQRNAFAVGASTDSAVRGPRRPALASSGDTKEKLLLMEVLRETAATGALSMGRIKPALEARVGAPMALSTVYRTLARHGWRKNAPFPVDLLEPAATCGASPQSMGRG